MKTSRLFAIKSPDEEADHPSALKRVLGPVELTFFGIGAIIGTGIFVLTGTAAAGSESRPGAGPAIVISFMVTAVACGLAALCYAEFASMIPRAGSAYTYAYSTFGELVAWIIGWDLILEYAVGNVGIAIGWSNYFLNVLRYFNIELPAWLCIDPMSLRAIIADPSKFGDASVQLAEQAIATAPNLGFAFTMNLPAMLIVLVVSTLLYVGVKESARFNNVLVILKLVMIGLFVWVGVQHLDFATNWHPFAPNGWNGVMTGASLIFFAYIGFDAVSTAAEESKNPKRDLPIAMIASLVICTILYIAVAIVLTGMAPLNVLNSARPVAEALTSVGAKTVADIISLGAVASITSVLVVMQLGQTRIFYAMGRDGLLPTSFSRVHSRFKTPHICTIVTGILVALPAGFIDISVAAEISNIGTLFAFILVAMGIMILRYREPNRSRGFKTPFIWATGPACCVTCFALMCFLPSITWIRFGLWMLIGLVLYFSYGYHQSKLNKSIESRMDAEVEWK